MIVKASQRSGGRALAAHLLNLRDNDHVKVHGIEGFTAADVTGAFVEIEAMSRATRCTQPFFSVSISPPKGETVLDVDFENAIAQIAATMGLSNQPRVILFHEKEARRHCHVVFSRIDAADIKAINLPFFKRRLTEISRELYLTHGFAMPSGLADKSLANPLNFGLEEWQVAKRAKRDPREIKAALKQCWERSDSAVAFGAALKERGFWLAQGDRRGFVAVDYKENVYSLSRWLGVKAKELKARLGEPQRHATVSDTVAEIDRSMGDLAKRVHEELDRKHAALLQPLLDRRRAMVERQRAERYALSEAHKRQRDEQVIAHASRLQQGLKGIWDWLTGKRKAIRRSLAAEATQLRSNHENQCQRQQEIQLQERKSLQEKIELARRMGQEERNSVFQLTSLRQAGSQLSGHQNKEMLRFATHKHISDGHEIQ